MISSQQNKGNSAIIFLIIVMLLVGYAFLVSVTQKNPTDTETKDGEKESSSNIVLPGAFKPYSGSGQSTTTTTTSGTKQTDEQKPKPEIKKITLSGSSSAKNTDPNKEYLTLTADTKNSSPIKISGLKLKSVASGQEAIIPKGFKTLTSTDFPGQPTDVYLDPGQKAILATTKSPVSHSFLLNSCSGYLGQFLNFVPSISGSCPLAKNEVGLDGAKLNDECLNYIDTIRSCQRPTDIPVKLNGICREFVNQNINYGACVNLHQQDVNFYKNEWRIYLGRTIDLWKTSREEINLLDENGNILSTLKY